MDPNVQVALVSVIATLITTLGVISVAVINNRKERDNSASAGVESGMDREDLFDRMLSLIDENNRKENIIKALRREIRQLRSDVEVEDSP